MSIEGVVLKHALSLVSIGKMGLNIAHPREFELYMCALELVDEDMNTLQYFVFPTMPTNMDESQTFASNVKRTLGGVTVLSTPTFTSKDVVLAGTFGRKFRVLLGESYEEVIASFKTETGKVTGKSLWRGVKNIFDKRVKTGYGCIKILEEIVEEVNKIDPETKKARRLILHNPAIGNSYIVKPVSLKQSMSQETNMLWSYSLNLKAVADLRDIYNKEELQQQRFRLVATGYIQRKIDTAVNGITRLLSSI